MAILLRSLAQTSITTNQTHVDSHSKSIMTDDEKKHIIHILTTPPNLETTLHTPLRSNMSLCLPTLTPTTTPVPNTLECGEILSCYKEHKVAARLTIKYTDRTHYNKYGTALLAMFIKKLVYTLKSIPKTSLACNKP